MANLPSDRRQATDREVYPTLYDFDLFDGLDGLDDFKCPICLCVMKDPQQLNCTGQHLFCKLCITNYLRSAPPSLRCPLDQSPVTLASIVAAPRPITNLISRLMAKCHFHTDGCLAKVPLEELEKHERGCRYRPCQPRPPQASASTSAVAPAPVSDGSMTLQIKMADGTKTIMISALPTNTVFELKRKIQSKEGIDATGLVLNFKTKQLDDNKRLSEYNIQDQSLLFSTRRFLGGI